MVDTHKQRKSLMQRLKQLQTLIDTETDTTFRDALSREKAECLEQIIKLTTQTPQLPSPTQDQDQATTRSTHSPTTTHNNATAEKYVTFHNDVNSVSLGKLGTLEANLLFAIFQKLKDKQDELLVFELDEIRQMTHAVKISHSDLSGVVKRLWNNIKGASFWVLLPKRDENYILFKTFAINYHDTKKTQVKNIEIQVNTPYFGYLLNYLHGNFTSFELLE
ncbi:replication initiation protein, partial [Helicobacter ailurogastricus]|uniref:replication initiation protein n=1 Tax=Helicobacter ailurogastricus TaxID=1578720 RepID=UPI002492EEB9